MRIYMQEISHISSTPRFCQILLQADLLGGWMIMRETGYPGSKGRIREEHHDEFGPAMEALLGWRDKQLNAGFKVVFVQGEEFPSS